MSSKGFTLIELLVVIAIIALLLSIIMPALRKAKDQVQLTICGSNQRQLVFGLTSYAVDNNDKLPPSPSKDDFVEGKYHLVGKSLDSEETYYGNVELVASHGNRIKVRRTISGITIMGIGAIEKETADNVNVLRIRFEENDVKHEETCMIDGDLDNYARITCYLYQPGVSTSNPGLEALFIDHDEN